MENLYKKLSHKYPLEIEYLYIYNLILPTFYESVNKKCDIRYINKLVKDKYPKYYRNKYLKIQAKCYLILVYYNLTFLAKFIIYIKTKMTRIK